MIACNKLACWSMEDSLTLAGKALNIILDLQLQIGLGLDTQAFLSNFRIDLQTHQLITQMLNYRCKKCLQNRPQEVNMDWKLLLSSPSPTFSTLAQSNKTFLCSVISQSVLILKNASLSKVLTDLTVLHFLGRLRALPQYVRWTSAEIFFPRFKRSSLLREIWIVTQKDL